MPQVSYCEAARNKEKQIDMNAYYRRLVLHFWQILQLEESLPILEKGNSGLVRQLLVTIDKSQVIGIF